MPDELLNKDELGETIDDYDKALSAIAEKATAQLNRAIARYEQMLGTLEGSKAKNIEGVVDVFRERDAVEILRQGETYLATERLEKLVDLDRRLYKQLREIAKDQKAVRRVNAVRQLLQPDKSYWWWKLQPSPAEIERLTRFDWLWNGLAVLFLGFSGVFIIQNVQVYQEAEFQLGQMLQAVAQGGAWTWAARATLLGDLKGKKKEELTKTTLELTKSVAIVQQRTMTLMEEVLASLNIPPYHTAEVKLAISTFVLLVAYGFHLSLPFVGDLYYRDGKRFFDEGEYLSALENYELALKFRDEDPKVLLGLGRSHEALANLEAAKNYYIQGVSQNDIASMNALARATLVGELQTNDWTGAIAPATAREVEFLLDRAFANLTKRHHRKAAELGVFLVEIPLEELELPLNSRLHTNYGLYLWSTVDLNDNPEPAVLVEASGRGKYHSFRWGAYQEVLAATGEALTANQLDNDENIRPGRATCFYRLSQLVNLVKVDKKAKDDPEVIAADRRVGNTCYEQESPIVELDIYDASIVYYTRRLEGLPKVW